MSNLKSDIQRYTIFKKCGSSSFVMALHKIIFAYGLHAVAVYRFGRWIEDHFHNLLLFPIKIILKLMYCLAAWWIGKAYGIHLSLNAEIGPGLYIGHFGGIEVGPCHIGSNCSIQQHVKILPDKITGNRPCIGSNVWIGAHARIEGCTIADRATVSAGAHVSKDVGYMNLVAGKSARIVSTNYDNREILGIML